MLLESVATEEATLSCMLAVEEEENGLHIRVKMSLGQIHLEKSSSCGVCREAVIDMSAVILDQGH